MCSGTDRGDDRLDPNPDADVVLRLAIRRLDIPSLGDPSGLGALGLCIDVVASPWPRLDIPATGAVEAFGSVSAVVGAAFAAGVDDIVSGCRPAENSVEVEGREEEEDLRDVGWSANVADLGEDCTGEWLAASGEDDCGREDPAKGDGDTGRTNDNLCKRGGEDCACSEQASGGEG